MVKRVTLLFTDEEWNFLYNLQTIAFIASYRNPSAAPISDILKAMINDRYYTGIPDPATAGILKKIKQDIKHDVDEEISRLGNLGYSKGNYVLNLSDYELESLTLHIKKRQSNEKDKITESKMVKILVKEHMKNLFDSINLAGRIYMGVLFGIGADGYVLLNNFYESLKEYGEKESNSQDLGNIEMRYKVLIPETSTNIKKDLPIVMDFVQLIKERGFPKDFNSFIEERKKYWSIVSYFNYMTASAGYTTSLRILIYPTSWIPDLIYGSFVERFPQLSDIANLFFLLDLFQLLRFSTVVSYIGYKESYKSFKNENWSFTKDKMNKDFEKLDELYNILEEYKKLAENI